MFVFFGIELVDDLKPLVIFMLLWTSLAFVVILLRIYTRTVIVRHQLGADDWLMTAALVVSIATDVGTGYQLKYGMALILETEIVVRFLHSLFATLSIYLVAQTLYKLSIAVQCYRLFSTSLGKRVIQALLAWITICGIVTFCGSTFYCFPMKKAWDERVEGGWCVDSTRLYYVGAALNILNDLFLIAIPIPFLVKLHVAPKQKVVLLSIFACGILVTAVSIIRIRAMFALRRTDDPNSNPAQNISNLLLWTHLELNLAIICGSIPALKAFFDRVILRRKESSNISSTSDSGQQSGSHSRRFGAGRSRGQDEEGGGVNVKTDIELRTHPLAGTDDTGSEKGLIVQYSAGAAWEDADILPVSKTYQRNAGLR